MSLKFDKTKKEGKDLVLEENVPVMVLKKTYVYFMTNDWSSLSKKLKAFGYKKPTEKDFRENPALHKNVRNKMAQLKATWSITTTIRNDILNYYEADKDQAYFIFLDEINGKKTPAFKMLEAIFDEETEIIRDNIKKGYDIEQRLENGLTFLMCAISYNKLDSLKMLLKLGADVNASAMNATTPLMYAVKNNSLGAIKLLLQQKTINIDAVDSNGLTALMMAAHCGYVDAVKLLIDAGANVNIASLYGETALHQSILNKKNDVSIILMDNGADLNKADAKGDTPFLDAIKVDDALIESELISRGARLGNNGKEKYVEVAAFNNSKESFNCLIEKRLLSDKEIQLGIALAIAFKHIDCAISLIRKSADQHESALTAFCFSCATNQKIVIDNFVDDLSFINEFSFFDMTPLMCSCYDRSGDIARKLIERGAEINLANKDGRTALMCAAEHENTKVIRLLIQNGADKSAKDKDGNTYEFYAKNPDKKSFVDILFEKLTQKQVNVKDEHKDIIPTECKSFKDKLYWHIQKYHERYPGTKDSNIYKSAGISKQTFSNMKKAKNHRPEKRNIQRLSAGLELSLKQAEDLMQSAGCYFDENDVIDTVVKDHLLKRNWNMIFWDIEIYNRIGKKFFYREETQQ